MGIASNLAALARRVTSIGLVPPTGLNVAAFLQTFLGSADDVSARLALGISPPLGYLSGLTLSRASATTFQVAAGEARNEDAGTARSLSLGAAITKSLSAWAVGSGNGGLDTGAVSANTWYHVHLIRRDSDGVIDALYSLSATAPTMPSGWTARRRLGSIRTDGSSQIVAFQQVGDTFTWDIPVSDVNVTNPGTSAVTRTLNVPTGVVVFPITAWSVTCVSTANIALLVTPLSVTNTTPSNTVFTHISPDAGANRVTSTLVQSVPTNASAQVRTHLSSSGASDVLRATTHGWIDARGK